MRLWRRGPDKLERIHRAFENMPATVSVVRPRMAGLVEPNVDPDSVGILATPTERPRQIAYVLEELAHSNLAKSEKTLPVADSESRQSRRAGRADYRDGAPFGRWQNLGTFTVVHEVTLSHPTANGEYGQVDDIDFRIEFPYEDGMTIVVAFDDGDALNQSLHDRSEVPTGTPPEAEWLELVRQRVELYERLFQRLPLTKAYRQALDNALVELADAEERKARQAQEAADQMRAEAEIREAERAEQDRLAYRATVLEYQAGARSAVAAALGIDSSNARLNELWELLTRRLEEKEPPRQTVDADGMIGQLRRTVAKDITPPVVLMRQSALDAQSFLDESEEYYDVELEFRDALHFSLSESGPPHPWALETVLQWVTYCAPSGVQVLRDTVNKSTSIAFETRYGTLSLLVPNPNGDETPEALREKRAKKSVQLGGGRGELEMHAAPLAAAIVDAASGQAPDVTVDYTAKGIEATVLPPNAVQQDYLF